jgi:hypothetical protein
MMGFQIVVLWSDVLIWLLVAAGIGLGVLISRNPPLLAAWRRVGCQPGGHGLGDPVAGLRADRAARLAALPAATGRQAGAEGAVCRRGAFVARCLAAPLRTCATKNLFGTVGDARSTPRKALNAAGQGVRSAITRACCMAASTWANARTRWRPTPPSPGALAPVFWPSSVLSVWLPRGLLRPRRPRWAAGEPAVPWQQFLLRSWRHPLGDGRKSGVARPASPGTRC